MSEREPHQRWLTRGTVPGLLGGLVLGIVMGDLMVGLMIGVIMGSGLGVLLGSRQSGDGRRRSGRGGRHSRDADEGGVDRGVLWLLVGLGAGVLLMLATVPEILAADPRFLGQLLVVALAAAIPGAMVFAVVALRRRNRVDDESR